MTEYGTFGETRLPPDKQARVEAELDKGEQLLWVGQPRVRRFMMMGVPAALVGIPFAGFAVFWMAAASGMMFGGFGNAPGPGLGFFACFPLFGLPFLFVGLGMVSAPFWLARRARNTFYALTDRRAILWEAGWWGSVSVRSFPPADMTSLRRNEYADGSGDLIFQEFMALAPGGPDPTYPNNYGRRTYWNRYQQGFLAIDRVRELEEIVRRVLLSQNKEKEEGGESG